MERFTKNLEMEAAISDIAPFIGLGAGAEILYTLGQEAYERHKRKDEPKLCPQCNGQRCSDCYETGTLQGYQEKINDEYHVN